MPDDLSAQIPVIRRVFEGFRVPVLMRARDGGRRRHRHPGPPRRRAGLDVFIVTTDKDARQLIGDHVRLLNLRTRKEMDADALEKDWGIRPDQVVDFLALTGDSVDNVPGVPGIGAGYAATFLKEFGTLDALLAQPGEVKGPKKQQASATTPRRPAGRGSW